MHGTPQTDRRCPPAPGEPRAYVPRSTAVAFVHKPALRKPAGHRLDGLRCQQLLPVHVVDTLHRDGAHAHIERASSAHTAAATTGAALCHAVVVRAQRDHAHVAGWLLQHGASRLEQAQAPSAV